jgi:hypothetical protein
VYEFEVTSYIYDEGDIIEKRQGSLRLDQAKSRKSNSLTLHF